MTLFWRVLAPTSSVMTGEAVAPPGNDQVPDRTASV